MNTPLCHSRYSVMSLAAGYFLALAMTASAQSARVADAAKNRDIQSVKTLVATGAEHLDGDLGPQGHRQRQLDLELIRRHRRPPGVDPGQAEALTVQPRLEALAGFARRRQRVAFADSELQRVEGARRQLARQA